MGKKINKNAILVLFLVILIVGCSPPTAESKEKDVYRSGTQGLVMNFLEGAPQKKMYVDAPYTDIEIPVSIEVRNKGAYPTSDDMGESLWETDKDDDVIFISGFDPNIISGWKIADEDAELIANYPYILLRDRIETLEGKSINNPEGGYDLLEFIGKIDLSDLDIEKYTPTFLVTACYDYKTKASPNVCIDPRPFTTVKERKVCEIHDISLSNQGAPIAITKVESQALSNSIQFKIRFKNVGKGDVIATDLLARCSGKEETGKLEKRHMDLVKIAKVEIAGEELNCGNLLSVEDHGGYARLFNNEGFVVCNLENYKENVDTAYITLLDIELAYGYRDAISKEVEIVKVPEAK